MYCIVLMGKNVKEGENKKVRSTTVESIQMCINTKTKLGTVMIVDGREHCFIYELLTIFIKV